MSDKTFVLHDGAEPSKRTAKRMSRMLSKSGARDAKRCAEVVLLRPMSGLDEKAEALGIYSESFHQLTRVKRKRLVAMAHSYHKQSA